MSLIVVTTSQISMNGDGGVDGSERQEDPFIFTLVLKPVLTAVKEARDLAAAVWALWGLGDDYTVRLVVSELVTNAIRASSPDQVVGVRFRRDDGTPVLEVWDESPEPVVMKATELTGTDGRGLYIVDRFVHHWEVHPTEDGGKVVRVEL
ncbi:ATP-binding protein [Spirillospora sp. NPDC047279]|uniref:ATP-binding protein n=1 Tax=Spirillospora sp. NPDC047279 TaxID=3155478 RepID=UPI0033CA1B97